MLKPRALGQGDRIVGISGYTVRPAEARLKPKVSAFINAKFDKIAALKPDLVLAFSDLQADLGAELVRRGITVVTFNQRTVAEILQMIAGGLRARITCLNPKVVDRGFAGREFDPALLSALPAAIDPCGERGEFHTCAYGGPMFSHEVAIETGITVERDGYVFTDLMIAARVIT